MPDTYTASIPDRSWVEESIIIALRRAFMPSLEVHRTDFGLIQFSVEGMSFAIEFLPERMSWNNPGWRAGEFNHNGRWQLTLNLPGPGLFRDYVKRPTEKQIGAALDEFTLAIARAVAGTARARTHPGPRLVVDNTRKKDPGA